MRIARRRRGQRAAGAAVAALLAGLAPRPGRAADDAAPPRPPVEIERTTPPVIVRAVRPAELPEDPTSFTSVIEAEDYAGENKGVEELLEQAAGVQVRRFGGPGQPAEVSIRGSSGAQVVVLLDGVRLNSAQSGSVDLSTIPPELIERIEVSRGGGSANNGSDAIGGVVNIVTKRPSAAPHTTATGARGSFHTWQASLTQTGRIGETEIVAGYDFFKTSGNWSFRPVQQQVEGIPIIEDDSGPIPRINNRTENHSGLLKVGRDFGDHFHIAVGDSFFHGESGRPGLDDPSGGALRGQSPTGFQRRIRNVADVTLEGAELGELGLDVELRAFHRFERSVFRDETPAAGAAIENDDRNTSYGGRLDLRLGGDLGAARHDGSLGLEVREDRLDSESIGGVRRTVIGVFVQDEIGFADGRVRFVPALRLDHTEGLGTEWIPRLGLVIEPWSWLRLKANGERSYRVPNFDELFFNEGSIRGNPALRPEEAVEGDIGLELGFDRLGPLQDVFFEAAAFHRDIENTIVFQSISPTVVAATNVSDAVARGVELAGGLRLLRWVGLSGTWTLLETHIRNTGNAIPGRPRLEYSGRVELGPKRGPFKLVGEARHVGAIPANESGSKTISARTTFDASLTLFLHRLPWVAGWLPPYELLLSLVGTNLTDVSVRDALAFPQPGRVVTLRIEARR